MWRVRYFCLWHGWLDGRKRCCSVRFCFLDLPNFASAQHEEYRKIDGQQERNHWPSNHTNQCSCGQAAFLSRRYQVEFLSEHCLRDETDRCRIAARGFWDKSRGGDRVAGRLRADTCVVHLEPTSVGQ